MKSAFNVFLAGLASLVLVACSGGGSISEDGGGGGTTPPDDSYSIVLELTDSDGQSISEISADTPGFLKTTLLRNDAPFGGGRVVFSLDGEGVLAQSSGVSDSQGVVPTVEVLPGDKLGGGTVTAEYTPSQGSVAQASISFNTKGDGGADTGGALVALTLVNDPVEMIPINSITSLSPGYLVATVSGISQETIVTFSSDLGEIPIDTAATVNGTAFVQLLAGTQPGAGMASATLVTGEKSAPFVFTIGATNVLLGSGSPFVSEVAEVFPSVISAGGTASISVVLQDSEGNPFTEPAEVKFTSTCASKASPEAEISSPVIAVQGKATSTYLAKGCVGDDTINVSANVGGKALSAKGTLNILPADVGSIYFIDANPELIRLKGTGGAESSTIRFKVEDKNGNPVSNQRVDFSLNTEIGGIELAPQYATTNGDGVAQTVVNAGTVATTVRVTAMVSDSSPLISSQSSVLVVSTGLPDQDSFSLSVDNFNPEGWEFDGEQVTVTARLADAFNNPVPDGTAVNFTTEGGVIEPSCKTEDGVCSVKWTSQNPRPTGKSLSPEVGPSLMDLGQPYGGRVTILATAIGEESFPDINGNGRFDESELADFRGKLNVSGEPFDLSEAFVDHNEDKVFDRSLLGGELETFVDFDNNGSFDTKDGLYNGSLCDLGESNTPHAGCSETVKSVNVRSSVVLVMSGSDPFITEPLIVDSCLDDRSEADACDGLNDNETLDILGKSTGGVSLIIADLHNQPMPSGTTVTFVATAGSLASKGNFIVPSTAQNGAIDYSVTIKGADQPDAGTLRIEVETPNGISTIVAQIPIKIH